MSGISDKLRDKIFAQAKYRCGYCLNLQKLVPVTFEIDHILPRANGGLSEEENLWLICPTCNGYKRAQVYAVDPLTNRRVRIFNPRRQKWSRHFESSRDKTRIIGKTACGRATVEALQMNNARATAMREKWISVGWFPPDD